MINHAIASRPSKTIDLQKIPPKELLGKNTTIISAPQTEQIAEIIDGGISPYGTQRYLVYLDRALIGKIFARGTHHYAKPQTDYIGIGKAFDNLQTAQDWLVDTHYDLIARPISIEPDPLGIFYVYRGGISVGECYYSQTYQLWVAFVSGDIRIHSEKFNHKHEAIDFILNRSLAAQNKPQLTKYLVSLESQLNFRTLTVEVDFDTIDWQNWLAYYNHNECEEFEILQIIPLN